MVSTDTLYKCKGFASKRIILNNIIKNSGIEIFNTEQAEFLIEVYKIICTKPVKDKAKDE